MIKNGIKFILQKLFGLKTYLFLFSLFMIKKLPWDKREGAFLKFVGLIRNEGHIIDIGANIGVMTYHFAKKLPESTIHSFEPIPINFSILNKIKDKFNLSNVILYQKALGEKNEQVKMILPKINRVRFHGLSHIVSDLKENGEIFTVDMCKLDDIKEFSNIDINAIKIDVENFEYPVLLGAEKIIQKNRPVIYCELWEGENRKNSFEFFSKLNYSVFTYERDVLFPYTEKSNSQNFFFIPAEHCEKQKLF